MSRLFHDLPIIEDVVAGRYPAPELGGPLRTTIRKIVVADSLDGAEAELVAGLDLGRRVAVVGDENTWPCWAPGSRRRCRAPRRSCSTTPRPTRPRPICCRSARATPMP